jgi:hypothetical protein
MNTQQVTLGLAAGKSVSVGTAGALAPKLTMSQQISQSEFARIRTTVEGVRTLNQSLTPASWAGIHGFILGAFKAQITKP